MSLLSVSGLRVDVDVPDLGWRPAVLGMNLELDRGGALGLVGESGCGKSLTVLAILGLLPEGSVQQTEGGIVFDGAPLRLEDPKSFRAVRGCGIGYVPQDPMSSLNPVFPVGEQVAEAVRLHHDLTRRAARDHTIALLAQVGIASPQERYGAYPHQLSGGQRQRVLIAIALAGDPELLIADEPTTALDVTVQAQVLRLLGKLRRDRALALLMVTHDLAVVAETCGRVSILYAGQCVEHGPSGDVLGAPRHPYTRGLLDSMPGSRRGAKRLRAIPGVVPSVGHWPSGCRFQDRCPRAELTCKKDEPALAEVLPGRTSACHFAGDLEAG